MFKNHLKTAFRSLSRNRVYSTIKIVGLTIGMVCATLILMWVNDELHFDSFHQNRNQIYRILVQRNGTDDLMAITPGLLAGAIKSDIPEVKYITRIMQGHRNPYKYEDNAFYEDQSYCVDPDFLHMFTFPVLEGNATSPFAEPNNMVITEKIAKKYFGDENPIGKNLRWNNRSDYQISAVIKDMPYNSHLQIQLMESHAITEKYWTGGYNWTNFVHETYIQLEENASVGAVEKKIETLLNQNCRIADRHFYIHLQPLTDIHLNASILHSVALTGDRKYVTIFSIIGLGILLIACVNFINISTANASSRMKEVAIRKVVGSSRKKLIMQFIGEFLLLTIIAALLALLVFNVVLPYFNQFTDKALSFDIDFSQFFLIIILCTAVLAGVYPAIYLSALSPNELLKSKMTGLKSKSLFQSALVVSQFVVSILLILCTFIINTQLYYIYNKKLGFEKDNVLYIPAKARLAENYESVKNRLMQFPDIRGITMQQSVPLTTINGSWVHWQGQTEQDLVVRNTQVTFDYFKTMNIGLSEGRYFSDKFATDNESAFILNEAAVDYLGLQSPVGMEISTGGRDGKIIGIVKNSHFKSLHHEINPLIFMGLHDYKSIDLFGVILIKFHSQNVPQLLSHIKNIWQEFNHDLPFEYHFLKETIDHQYDSEQRLSTIFTVFSLMAIFISCLGLFALTLFTTVKRTKEIGIRKSLGANSSNLMLLLMQEFTGWVLIANIIAWPIGWFIMDKWLQNFAYHIHMQWWMFMVSGLIALTIALLTTGVQTLKAATASPVEALRYE